MQFQTNSPQLHAHAFILSDTRCNTLVKSFSSARACKHWRLHVRFYLGLYTNNHTPIAFVMFGKSVGDISRKNNKGVLDRPWTTQRVLKAISSTLKFEFTVNPDSWRFDVRQKIGDTGPIKLRTIFPHTSVLSKPTNCHMGSTNQVFHVPLVSSRFNNKCLDWWRAMQIWQPRVPWWAMQLCGTGDSEIKWPHCGGRGYCEQHWWYWWPRLLLVNLDKTRGTWQS